MKQSKISIPKINVLVLYKILHIFIQFSGFYSEIPFAGSNCSNIDQLRQFSNHPRALLILILHDCLECRSGVSSNISKMGATTSLYHSQSHFHNNYQVEHQIFSFELKSCNLVGTQGHS